MKCPHCGKKVGAVTTRQLEAFRLVYMHNMSLGDAGRQMGICKSAVCHLLKRMQNNHPAAFDGLTHQKGKNPYSYSENRHFRVVVKI